MLGPFLFDAFNNYLTKNNLAPMESFTNLLDIISFKTTYDLSLIKGNFIELYNIIFLIKMLYFYSNGYEYFMSLLYAYLIHI